LQTLLRRGESLTVAYSYWTLHISATYSVPTTRNSYYYYYYYYHHYHHHRRRRRRRRRRRIAHFSALAGKYSLILGFSNQQD
jgi:hypothetical protein